MGDSETDRLRVELAAANREIGRLPSLLGLSDDTSDAGRGWEPSLFAVGEPLPSVDESSSSDQKLALFRALFAGRSDVYATRWENASSGERGWSPAVRGGWPRAKSGARREYLPLTDDVLVSHLRGDAAVGIYPLMHKPGHNRVVNTRTYH